MCISLVACGDSSSEGTENSEVVADPIEEAKTKLSDAYDNCCGGDNKDYASLGYDGKSLTIDTKPNDSYYSGEADALSAIAVINVFLGLPSSLIDKMSSTRALDGIQSQDCGNYTVTWNYHPDNGMKVIYEVNG